MRQKKQLSLIVISVTKPHKLYLPSLSPMEQLRARATEQKRLKTQILNQTSKLEASFNALYRSCVKLTIYGKGAHSNAVQWQGCGIVVRIYRKDTPRLSLHNKHTDGVVCIGTREAVEGSFIAGHCRVTFYDKNRGVGLDRAGLGPEEFWYNPKIEREKLEALKKKVRRSEATTVHCISL